MSTRHFSGGKGGRCLRLTTYHPRSAERQENPVTEPTRKPLGPPQPVVGDLYLFIFCLFSTGVTVCRLTDRIRTACLGSEVVTALAVDGAVVYAVTVSK